MKIKVTTKNGAEHIVEDTTLVWLQLERDLGKTYTEAIQAAANGSLEVITYLCWKLMVLAGHSEAKSQDGFVQHELVRFEALEDEDPKVEEPSGATL